MLNRQSFKIIDELCSNINERNTINKNYDKQAVSYSISDTFKCSSL